MEWLCSNAMSNDSPSSLLEAQYSFQSMTWSICNEDKKDLMEICSENFIISRSSLLVSFYFFSNTLLNT